jgi:hypothetical protein
VAKGDKKSHGNEQQAERRAGTPREEVAKLVERLIGLRKVEYPDDWEEDLYVSILRRIQGLLAGERVEHLLVESQSVCLLGGFPKMVKDYGDQGFEWAGTSGKFEVFVRRRF